MEEGEKKNAPLFLNSIIKGGGLQCQRRGCSPAAASTSLSLTAAAGAPVTATQGMVSAVVAVLSLMAGWTANSKRALVRLACLSVRD